MLLKPLFSKVKAKSRTIQVPRRAKVNALVACVGSLAAAYGLAAQEDVRHPAASEESACADLSSRAESEELAEFVVIKQAVANSANDASAKPETEEASQPDAPEELLTDASDTDDSEKLAEFVVIKQPKGDVPGAAADSSSAKGSDELATFVIVKGENQESASVELVESKAEDIKQSDAMPRPQAQAGCTTDGLGSRMPGQCLDGTPDSPPNYDVDLGGQSMGALSAPPDAGLFSNPFASRLAPGFDNAGADIIGDFLKSGGLVTLNFRPGGIAPMGANQSNALVRDGDRFTFTDGNGNAFVDPMTGNRVIYRAPMGLGLDDPTVRFPSDNNDGTFTFRNLDRVTLDSMGNEVRVESNQSVKQNTVGSADFTGRVDTGVAALVNPAVANVGVVKAAEGSNPVPRDRVFFFYSFFDNVQLGSPNGININRCTPGFEKTFFNQTASFEARFPFASTLDSTYNFTQGASNNTSNSEFGDILLTVKSILMQESNWLITGGVQVSLPTANDLKFVFTDSVLGNTQTAEFLRIENEAFHVMPLLAGMWLPDDRWFVQGFAQLDFDTTGKPVLLNNNPFVPGSTFQSIGRFTDATFLYADISVGYWLMRDPPESTRMVTGFAPQVELHYNRSLTDGDLVRFGDIAQVGTGASNLEVLNLTVGGAFELWHQTVCSVGFATPIAGGADKEFNGELRVLLSHRFGGGQSAFSRAPSNR